MISAILVDVLVIGSVVAFAWAGAQLGVAASLVRAAGVLAAVLVAAIVRDGLGGILDGLPGASVDMGRLLAMLLAGGATYFAVAALVRWQVERRELERLDDDEPTWWDDDRLGAVPGAVVGLVWATFFAAVLVLLPADNFLSRGAIASQSGRALIAQEGLLRWLDEGFPHYTQTLPKGDEGAVAGPVDDDLVMRRTEPVEPTTDGVDRLLGGIDQTRKDDGLVELVVSPRLNELAERHAVEMLEEEFLRPEPAGGGSLEDQVLATLGDQRGRYVDDAGIVVAWAHTAPNAFQALMEDDETGPILRDERWTEVGIGSAEAGWFAGRMYVVVLVGRIVPGSEDGLVDEGELLDEDAPADGGDGDGTGPGSFDPAPGDGATGTPAVPGDVGSGPSTGGNDADGDGLPDQFDPDPFTPDGGETMNDLDGDGQVDELQ